MTCAICGHTFQTRSKTGHTNCGNCLSRVIFDKAVYDGYRRTYYLKTAEKQREQKRVAYWKTREKVRAYQKAHYDREKAVQRVREWVRANPEKQRDWRRKNAEKIKDQKRSRYRLIKEEVVRALGGKCQLCGYQKCLNALVLHHKDMNAKEKEKDWVRASTFEPRNYLLLCANCHAEIHQKMREEASQTFKDHSTAGQTSERKKTHLSYVS